MPTSLQRNGLTFVEILIIVLIIGVLAAIAIPNRRYGGERANARACYANMKTIAGAIEMYNLDYVVTRDSSGSAPTDQELYSLESPDTEKTEKTVTYQNLVDSGYLQNIPMHPGTNEKPQQVYRFDETGTIYCKSKTDYDYYTTHGYIQDPAESVKNQ